MAAPDNLLVRLARAVAITPTSHALSERLCLASCGLAGADAAALTVAYAESNRVTLFATDEVSARLEDLQEVMGEGPGFSAAGSGGIQVCPVGTAAAEEWPMFARAAIDVVGRATLHAVPMQPDQRLFGVMTLYQLEHPDTGLALDASTLLRLGAAIGAALISDPEAVDQDLREGPWQSRTSIYQATGMVVAQLSLEPGDALAVLKAHAYAGETTIDDIAHQVITRAIRFFPDGDGQTDGSEIGGRQ